MFFSIIVPAYNASQHITPLLRSINKQTFVDFELIVVDDCSTDGTIEMASNFDCRIIPMSINGGPARCRNVGAQAAKGDVLVFTDSDCEPTHNWLENIAHAFSRSPSEALMGKVMIKPSTVLGNSISALGFPAGGAIGFENIWPVDENNHTTSLSTCNCAVPTDIFWSVGGFDESFPYAGGEDSLFAYNLINKGYAIAYHPDVVIYHAARDSLKDFIRWHFKRGISSYLFAQKVNSKTPFISLRLWSIRNIIKKYYKDIKFPLILFLLCLSYWLQCAGYLYTRIRGSNERLNH